MIAIWEGYEKVIRNCMLHHIKYLAGFDEWYWYI
jgi:hypothetical protein